MDHIPAAKALLAKVRGTVREIEALSTAEFVDPAVSRLMAEADFSAVREAGFMIGALYRGALQADQAEGSGECGVGASCRTYSSAWHCTAAGCDWRKVLVNVVRNNQGFSWYVRTQKVNCPYSALCQSGPLSEYSVGAITTERDDQDRIVGFVARGKVPGVGDDPVAAQVDLDVAVRLGGQMIDQGAGTLTLLGRVRSENVGAGSFLAYFDERSALAVDAAGKLIGMRLGLSPFETAHHRFEGMIQLSDFARNEAFSADELLPQALAFEGAVTDIQYPEVGKFFLGNLRFSSALSELNPHQPLSRTNFPRSALQLGGEIKVASRKSIGLYLDAKHRGPDENTLAIDYSFTAAGETSQFKVEVTTDDNGINAQAVIHDVSGIGLRFARAGGITASEGEVLRDPTTRIGRINTRTGIVHFNDGSYESLY